MQRAPCSLRIQLRHTPILPIEPAAPESGIHPEDLQQFGEEGEVLLTEDQAGTIKYFGRRTAFEGEHRHAHRHRFEQLATVEVVLLERDEGEGVRDGTPLL